MSGVVRAATPADVGDIHRLVHALAVYEKMTDKFTASVDDYRRALFGQTPRIHALVAQPEGAPRPVGAALFYYTFSTFKPYVGMFLEDLFVEESHRGQGLGLGLLRALAQHAIAEGCNRIDWHVLNWNTPSIGFYAGLGATEMTDWHVRQLQGDALRALALGDAHG